MKRILNGVPCEMIARNEAQIGVSVICTCYNQSSYISDALDGFISQQCNFPYEIIVHDDASLDGTSEIVLRYAKQYPNLIFPIIQVQNQFSQGISGIDVGLSRARYKYVALCEGDDYWVDSLKLQKQFDFMESHDDYSLCLHNAIIHNCLLNISYLSESGPDREKTTEDIIGEGGGEMNPTASFFFRRDLLTRACRGPVSDHFIMMELACKGRVFWLDEPMSVYRLNSKGSWSQNKSNSSIDSIEQYYEKYENGLESFNRITNERFAPAINELKSKLEANKASQIIRSKYLNNCISLSEVLAKSGSILTVFKLAAEKVLPESIELMIRKTIKRAQKNELIVK